jgi:hypothetical protein
MIRRVWCPTEEDWCERDDCSRTHCAEYDKWVVADREKREEYNRWAKYNWQRSLTPGEPVPKRPWQPGGSRPLSRLSLPPRCRCWPWWP